MMPVGLKQHEIYVSWPPVGSLPSPFFIIGNHSVLATGLTASSSVLRDLMGQRLNVLVNTLTGSGILEITGTRIHPDTGVPSLGFSEQLAVTGVGAYQTVEKWWQVTNVAVQGGISAINYNLRARSFLNFPGRWLVPLQYRLEVVPTGGVNRNFRLIMTLTQVSPATKRVTDTVVEDILFTRSGAGSSVVDNLRVGAADRSATVPMLENVGGVYLFSMLDLDSVLPSLYGGNEGLFASVEWQNIDYFTLFMELQSGPEGSTP